MNRIPNNIKWEIGSAIGAFGSSKPLGWRVGRYQKVQDGDLGLLNCEGTYERFIQRYDRAGTRARGIDKVLACCKPATQHPTVTDAVVSV